MKNITYNKVTYAIEPGAGLPDDAVGVESLTLRELADLYNNFAISPIKGFKDKPTGVARTTKALIAWDEANPTSAAVPTTKKSKTGGINFLGMRTEIQPKDAIIPLKKKGTTLARMLVKLLEGATRQDLVDEFAAIDKERGRVSKRPINIRIYETVRGLCYTHGYGIKSTSTVIQLIVAK